MTTLDDFEKRCEKCREIWRTIGAVNSLRALVDAVFTYLCKDPLIKNAALFHSDKLIGIKQSRGWKMFQVAYGNYTDFGMLNSFVDTIMFVRIRELSGYIFAVDCGTAGIDLVKSIIEQASAVRKILIEVVENRNLIQALAAITEDFENLQYIKASGGDEILIVTTRERTVKMPFRDLRLYFNNLVRVARSYIVNPDNVKELVAGGKRKTFVVMKNGKRIKVPEVHVDEIIERFG